MFPFRRWARVWELLQNNNRELSKTTAVAISVCYGQIFCPGLLDYTVPVRIACSPMTPVLIAPGERFLWSDYYLVLCSDLLLLWCGTRLSSHESIGGEPRAVVLLVEARVARDPSSAEPSELLWFVFSDWTWL